MFQKTIKRRLKENGYYRGVYKKKVITNANRKKRMSWCREKRWWNVQNQWSKMIFSDESQICVGENNCVYVWKKAGEGWRPDLEARQNGKKFSMMVWGVLVYSRCRNIMPSWREYKLRKIYWHLRYKSLACYCTVLGLADGVIFFKMITPLYIGLVPNRNTSPETE